MKNKNVHNHNPNEHKTETQQLRVRVRKNCGDISQRPSKIIRGELQKMEENLLNPKDLKNVAMSIYRERRKNMPKLPKCKEDVHEALNVISTETNKSENFTLVNDLDTGIVIFSCSVNLECLCNEMEDIFIDGTFKYCPKFFYQLYSIHGCLNGNYIPLVFALLPAKTEECYMNMWNFINNCCQQRNLVLSPKTIHIDFEQAMHNAVRVMFPNADISCCRFHLGQSWWRRIQTLGLSTEYKEKSCEAGKWLSQFFGLAFLSPVEIEDCFVEDIMAETPQNDKCIKFADYILETYIASDAKYPPQIWAAPPDPNTKRTTNGPESFHAHFNSQFYSSHPSIFVLLDVLQKIQTTTYIKIRSSSATAPVRKNDRERLNFVTEQYQKYIREEISRSDFIRSVGYKFSARTDM